MNPRTDAGPTDGRTLTCQVAEWGILRAEAAAIDRMRRQPATAGGVKLPPASLKNADDQTVLGLSTVLRAIANGGREAATFQNWGVVCGPKMFGRDAMAAVLARYAAEGAWGVPPHMIPHRTLHASSGTISQALSIHGPNMTVGGGPTACTEAFRIAATLLAENTLPGLWLVLSAYEGEKLPDNPDCAGMNCNAAALALTVLHNPWSAAASTSHAGSKGARLSIGLEPALADKPAEFTLPEFRAALENQTGGRWNLPEVGWVEFQPQARVE